MYMATAINNHTVRIFSHGSALDLSVKQADSILSMLVQVLYLRNMGKLNTNRNFAVGSTTVGYRGDLGIVQIGIPNYGANVHLSSVKSLVEDLSVVLGHTSGEQIDSNYLKLWATNVVLGAIMLAASIILMLPPTQRLRWLYSWLIRTADNAAVNSERSLVIAKLESE